VLAYHLLGDPHQTDDALQDAYVKAFRGLRTFAGRSALSTWLTRITYTTCVDHLRRRARLVLVPDLEPEQRLPDGPDPTDDLAGRSWVRDALRRLPPEQRAVVVLVGVQGLDYEHAAEILGVPSGTVASRLSTARTTLRSALRGGDAPLVAAASEEGLS
jgi:RNA polymerase sigma-70 factor, ECF subfamily